LQINDGCNHAAPRELAGKFICTTILSVWIKLA
jgi:hypothetical protein